MTPSAKARSLKLTGVLASAVLMLAILAGSAQAACPYSGAEQVFESWGDERNYVLAPDGGFEAGGSDWTLSRGVKAVRGNEGYYLNDAADSRSLALPADSSAASPPICMSLDTPVFRFVARNTGDPSSRLRVEAVYKLLDLVQTNVISDVTAGSSWAPSEPISTVLGLSTIAGTLIPSAIEVRFTPLDSLGEWRVDDFYVDPFARR
jgi:hypothetical protein